MNTIKFDFFHKIINYDYINYSYYICATPNVYCKGSAVQLENGTIVTNKRHTHEAHCQEFQELETKNNFRKTLIERSKLEMIDLKVIYDQEAIRYK